MHRRRKSTAPYFARLAENARRCSLRTLVSVPFVEASSQNRRWRRARWHGVCVAWGNVGAWAAGGARQEEGEEDGRGEVTRQCSSVRARVANVNRAAVCLSAR
jgi:hypothetical protein